MIEAIMLLDRNEAVHDAYNITSRRQCNFDIIW